MRDEAKDPFFTPGTISGVSFSPRGLGAVLCGQDTSRLLVYDPRTGERLQQIPIPFQAVAARALGEGWLLWSYAQLARAAPDGTLLWSVDAETLLAEASTDGLFVASLSRESCFVRSAADGSEIWRLDLAPDAPTCLALSPDGARLAIGTSKGAVLLVDRATGAVRARHKATKTLALAFSPDGARLLVGHGQGQVRLRDGHTLAEDRTFAASHAFGPPGGGPAGVRWAALSPDGTSALTLGNERQIRTWAVPSGAPGPSLEVPWHHAQGCSIALSADGRYLAAGSSGVTLSCWDRSDGSLSPRSPLPFEPSGMSHDGEEMLFLARFASGRLRPDGSASVLVRSSPPVTDDEARFPLTDGAVSDLPTRSRDGRWLAVPSGAHVDLYDAASRMPLARIPCENRAKACVFGPDSSWIVTVDQAARVWSVDRDPIALARVPLDWGQLVVRGLAMSGRGRLAISADSWDNHFTAASALLLVDLGAGLVRILTLPDAQRLGQVGWIGGDRFAVVDSIGRVHVAGPDGWEEVRQTVDDPLLPPILSVHVLTAEPGRIWHTGLGGRVYAHRFEPGEASEPATAFARPARAPVGRFEQRLRGSRFLFIGRFSRSTQAMREQTVIELGATVAKKASASVTHAVIARPQYGAHTPPQAERDIEALVAGGADISLLGEVEFLRLAMPTREEATALLGGEIEGGRDRFDAWIARGREKCHDLALSLGGIALPGADLSGVDLRYADLTGANLRGANLSEAKLERAHLRGADLRDTDLTRTNVYHAELQGADLRGALIPSPLYVPLHDETTRWPDGYTP